MSVNIKKDTDRHGNVIGKTCEKEKKYNQMMPCKHNNNPSVCVGCAVYTGHGDKPTLFEF